MIAHKEKEPVSYPQGSGQFWDHEQVQHPPSPTLHSLLRAKPGTLGLWLSSCLKSMGPLPGDTRDLPSSGAHVDSRDWDSVGSGLGGRCVHTQQRVPL